MTMSDHVERRLPELLDELAAPRTPDYLDDLHRQLAATRQRPAWTLPERWLQMAEFAGRVAVAPRVPLRAFGAVTLLILLLVAAALVYFGSRPKVLAPFGPAANGIVTYASNGDIFTADPATGRATAVVTGSVTDIGPVFSRDGEAMVFERKASGAYGPGDLYLAHPDGSGLRRLTPSPIKDITGYGFSPGGREITLTAGTHGASAIWIVEADGSGIRRLPVGGLSAGDPEYRPPSGDEIVFVGQVPGKFATGLYAVRSDGTGLRTIVEPTTFQLRGPHWSPTGDRLAYTSSAVDLSTLGRPHIVRADGSGDRIIRPVAPGDFEGYPNLWSNDGTRLLIGGCYMVSANASCQDRYSIVPVDGTGPTVEIMTGFPKAPDSGEQWAPDDSFVVSAPNLVGIASIEIWDARTGAVRDAAWRSGGPPSMQRRAR